MSTCITSAGYNTAWSEYKMGIEVGTAIRQAGAVAAAIANASSLTSNYRKQRDVADRSLKISEEEQTHASATYWPRELQFLIEFGTPEEVDTVDAYGRRYAGHLIPQVAKAFATKIKLFKCGASRYCTGKFALGLQQLYQAQATAVTNAKILGYCMGFAQVQSKNDLNDERRRQAIAIGKGLFGMAASALASAGAGLANAGAGIAGQLNSALELFGYAKRATIDSVNGLDFEAFQNFQDRVGFTVGQVTSPAAAKIISGSSADIAEKGFNYENTNDWSTGGANGSGLFNGITLGANGMLFGQDVMSTQAVPDNLRVTGIAIGPFVTGTANIVPGVTRWVNAQNKQCLACMPDAAGGMWT